MPKGPDIAPELLATIVASKAFRELQVQIRRIETAPDDAPLTEDQDRKYAEIILALDAILSALTANEVSGIAASLGHVALLIKLLADGLGVPRAPFPFGAGSAARHRPAP